jgi:hypothetical protein
MRAIGMLPRVKHTKEKSIKHGRDFEICRGDLKAG